MSKKAESELHPQDHGEEVALFRAEVIGALGRQELERGELAEQLRELSHKSFRLPGADLTRSFSVPTLERWLYAYRHGGLEALRPKPRSDKGPGRALTAEQRELLCDIRREHPSAGVPLILRTLCQDGRLAKDVISESGLRRLYPAKGLDRQSLRTAEGGHTRLRWQAERPGALWHADVCHGPNLLIQGSARPLRIHALLDDASRYIVAIDAYHTEREADMLALYVRALRRYGGPDVLYLDNGSTYRGQSLRLCCERLGTTLLHAAPYDPQARGKMERFWRSLRQGCLDHLGSLSSLHEVQVRLWAFVDQHYHNAPHAGLMGVCPGQVFAQGMDNRGRDPDRFLSEQQLHQALTVRVRRRVSRDNVVSVQGQLWETDRGFLAGRHVTVAYSLLGGPTWVEHDGAQFALSPVDPKHNATRARPKLKSPPAKPSVPFDPPKAQLDQWLGGAPEDDLEEELF
jgi:putative transposase